VALLNDSLYLAFRARNYDIAVCMYFSRPLYEKKIINCLVFLMTGVVFFRFFCQITGFYSASCSCSILMKLLSILYRRIA